MKQLINFSIKNPMVVNIFAIVVVVIGLMLTINTRKEIFPEMTLDIVSITVPFPGASAEEVEEGVTIKVEESIKGIDGIDYIESTSAEGAGFVTIFMRTDVKDTRKVLDDIKDAVDSIFTFPEDAEEPLVRLREHRSDIIAVTVYGDLDELAIRNITEDIRDEMLLLPEISKISESGMRPIELVINLSEENMRRYAITYNEVVRAVRNYDFDISGGTIKTDVEEMTLRAFGRNYRAAELADVVLRARPDGTKVTLADVADVKQEFSEVNYRFRYMNQPATMLLVLKSPQEDAIKIADAVKKYVELKKETLPDGVGLAHLFDSSKILKQRISLLVKNAKYAIVLVFIMLMIFLGARLSFWVAVGLPVALMGTIILLRTQDVTINMMSLFAFIMVMGILVDDSIVVAENVQQHVEMGKSPVLAAMHGAIEVYPAVFASVATTIVAFSPFFMIVGVWGKFLFPIAAVAAFGLVVSLIECLLILPSHLGHSLRPIEEQRADRSLTGRLRNKTEQAIQTIVDKTYKPVLALIMKWRWQTLALGFAMFIISIGVVASGQVKFVFFPNIDGDWITVNYTLEPGSSMAVQNRVSNHIISTIEQIDSEYTEKRNEFIKTAKGRKYSKQAGPDTPIIEHYVSIEGRGSADAGMVQLELIDSETRGISSKEIANRWRQLIGEVPGVIRWSFDSTMGPGGTDEIVVQLAGDDMDELLKAAALVKDKLREYPGAYDVQDDLEQGKKEIRMTLNDRGKALGLTFYDLALQVRQGFYGAEIHRIQRGSDEIKVWVRHPKEERNSIADFETIKILTPLGGEVPLTEVAELGMSRQLQKIQRYERKRRIVVKTKLDMDRLTPEELKGDLNVELPALLRQVSGVTYKFEGQNRSQMQMMMSMQKWFKVSLVVIFIIIALTFRNYLHSFMIMMLIPMGFVGAVVGHLVIPLINPRFDRMDLTMLSVGGVVALAGIVVNDSIVMIDTIKRNLRKGLNVYEAVFNGASSRFRPIVLTTFTTSIGLMPLIMEQSLQAQFLIPMAGSVAFGLLVATFFTQVWLPAFFLCLNDLKGLWYIMATGRQYSPTTVELNALPEGNFIKGIFPSWMIILITAIVLGLFFFYYYV